MGKVASMKIDYNQMLKHLNQQIFFSPKLAKITYWQSLLCDKVYKCDICTKPFKNLPAFKGHQSEHEGDTKKFECINCGKGFHSNNRLYNHLNRTCLKKVTKAQNELIFKCPACAKVFTKKCNMRAHFSIFHEIQKSNKVCNICGNEFISNKQLKRHMTSAHGYKSDYHCKDCDKYFTSKTGLNTHIKQIHEKIRFSCDLCEKSFTAENTLKNHKISFHDKSKEVRCNLCEKLFSTFTQRNCHVINSHRANLDLPCETCNKIFHTKASLKCHRKIHRGKAEKCEQCESSFVTKGQLRVHVNAVHLLKKEAKCDLCNIELCTKKYLQIHLDSIHKGTTIKCELCDETFSNKTNLNQHKKRKHDIKTMHKCTFCDKSFAVSADKRKHEIMTCRPNLNQTLHTCEKCDKQFKYFDSLKTHIKIMHEISEPFKCSYCNKPFTRTTNLKTHIRNIHLKSEQKENKKQK